MVDQLTVEYLLRLAVGSDPVKQGYKKYSWQKIMCHPITLNETLICFCIEKAGVSLFFSSVFLLIFPCALSHSAAEEAEAAVQGERGGQEAQTAESPQRGNVVLKSC